jgi:hypothetical protein
MGIYFTDKFSLLHFASGISVYYWNISLIQWFIIHTLFEIIENSPYGMVILNKIKIWPGGKDTADSFINSLGDTFYSILGWLFAYYVDTIFS